MITRKPGPLTAADRKALRAYQAANGLQADGKAGHQSVNHLLDAAMRSPQPDDPGAGPVDSEGLGGFPNGAAFLIVGIAAVLAAAALAWAMG